MIELFIRLHNDKIIWGSLILFFVFLSQIISAFAYAIIYWKRSKKSITDAGNKVDCVIGFIIGFLELSPVFEWYRVIFKLETYDKNSDAIFHQIRFIELIGLCFFFLLL